MGNVFPPARSAKLQILYVLKMSKTAALDTFTIQTFYMYMYCVYGWWIFSRGGSQRPRGGGGGGGPPPPPPPQNETLYSSVKQTFWCIANGMVLHASTLHYQIYTPQCPR